jgi:hypothetical protein
VDVLRRVARVAVLAWLRSAAGDGDQFWGRHARGYGGHALVPPLSLKSDGHYAVCLGLCGIYCRAIAQSHSLGERGNWRQTWAMVAGISVVAAAIATLFVKERPEDLGQSVDGGTLSGQPKALYHRQQLTTTFPWEPRQAYETLAYWMIVAGAIAWIAYGAALLYGLAFGWTFICLNLITGNYYGPAAFPKLSGMVYLIAAAFCSPAGVLAGKIFDLNHSYKLAFELNSVVAALGILALFFAQMPAPPKTNHLRNRPARKIVKGKPG